MGKDYEGALDLVELFELVGQGRDPEAGREDDDEGLELEVGRGEVRLVLEADREAREARLAARDMRISARARTDPARVSAEMKRRSDYLRSRPLRGGFYKRELAILGELDAIEAAAREVEELRQLGAISDSRAAAETEALGPALFAVRGRYADVLDAIGGACPSRGLPDPEARQRELSQIDEFLARKAQRAAA